MRALLSRELEVIARCQAFVVSACVHVIVLGAFVLAWSQARLDPLFGDRHLYQLTRAVQAILLAVVLPWTVARCAADERDDDLVVLAAMTATRPSRVILARTVATLLALAVIVASALPVALLAQRLSGGSISELVVDQAAMIALAIVACASVFVCRYCWPSRLLGWVAAEISTLTLVVGAVLTLPTFAAAASLVGSIGLAALLLLSVRGDRSLRYLSEQTG